MSDEPEPDWNLLPHNPRSFFALEEGFDRKDLKRQYNKLIKRYRPEREPALFQKIRAAFEQLDGAMRYGQSVSEPVTSHRYEWRAQPSTVSNVGDNSEHSSPYASSTSPHLASDRLPDTEHWGKTDPLQLYKQFQAKSVKSPFDYYALSILADVAVPNDSLLFIKWLLTGLKEHPQDPALYALIYQWAQSCELGGEDAIKILIAMAKTIGDDRFFFVSEKLLNQLANKLEWTKFQLLLTRCEQSLRDHRIQGRIVFYIQLLRKVMLRAPRDWIAERIQWLDKNADSVAGHLEFEIEINRKLFEYLEHREKFISKGDIARRIDLCIRSYCADSEEVSDQKIVELNVEIASDFSQLETGLDSKLSESLEPLGIWNWISREVAYRLDLYEDTHKSEQMIQYTYTLLRQIEESFPRWKITTWDFANYGIRFAYYIIYLYVVLELTHLLSEFEGKKEGSNGFHWNILCFLLMFGFLIFDWFFLWKKYVLPWRQKRLRSMIDAEYQKSWRAIIARFISANRVGMRPIIQCTEAILQSNHGGQFNVAQLMPQLLVEDAGLFLFGVATMFLK